MKRCVTLVVVMLAALAICVTAASATVVHICVPEKAGSALTSDGTSEACKEKETPVQLPASATEQKKLISILPYINYVASGVGGKPTIQFAKANLQIINGEGKTSTVNGVGNIVIGYDETPGTQTGSHNLVLGGTQAYTSYGDVVGGSSNTVSTPLSAVFGFHNIAEKEGSYALLTGEYNVVGSPYSSVLGGCANRAGAGTNQASSKCSVTGVESDVVSGGSANEAEGAYSSISGGEKNKNASGNDSSISGGASNHTRGYWLSVSGGDFNAAESEFASITGGYQNTATNRYTSVTGGADNFAIGNYSTVTGGTQNETKAESSTVVGGEVNKTSLSTSNGVVVGGKLNEAGLLDTVLGGSEHILTGNEQIFPE